MVLPRGRCKVVCAGGLAVDGSPFVTDPEADPTEYEATRTSDGGDAGDSGKLFQQEGEGGDEAAERQHHEDRPGVTDAGSP